MELSHIYLAVCTVKAPKNKVFPKFDLRTKRTSSEHCTVTKVVNFQHTQLLNFCSKLQTSQLSNYFFLFTREMEVASR